MLNIKSLLELIATEALIIGYITILYENNYTLFPTKQAMKNYIQVEETSLPRQGHTQF
jgi:hypothetical protein